MYLARVEMSGFKSFADKTVIEFDQGMTAVVGPNGSGKSNLTEAIRWVLGEQSAKSLRGNKMEDVIFNGTQNRKPINIAKVSLILNNEDRYLDLDCSEIAITRTYNRNGESQYSINKEVCRLKDIVDLLLDTGLGKNSFSIISQGQVEQIFLNKPEERRSIFEEAAGVQKYQYRKNEAERKLFRSQDHLSRVKDIIHELNLQLTPLEKQKEDALLYLNLKEELKNNEISLYTYQISQSKKSWEKDAESLNIQKDSLDALEEESEELRNKVNNAKEEYQILIDKIDQLTENHQKIVQEIERGHGEINVLKQKISFNQSDFAEKNINFDVNQKNYEKIQTEIIDISEILNTNILQLEVITKKIARLTNDKTSVSGLNDIEIEVLRSEMIDIYQEKASASNQIQQNKQTSERLNYKKQTIIQKLNDYSINLEELLKEKNTLTHNYKEAQALYQEQKNEFLKLQDTIQKNQMKHDEMKRQIFETERRFNQEKYHLESLKRNQEEYVGYYAGIRAVMKQKEKIKGIHKPVADIIKVEEKYQVALDIALGAASQHIIVENDQTAKAAIEVLKREKAGRATFLPLTNIKSRMLNSQVRDNLKTFPGYLGIAKDLVSYESIYENIIGNLLGSTIIVDNINNAQNIARSTQHRYKLVTLEGDLLLPGGSITGGKQKNQQQSMLNRQNQLAQQEKNFELIKTQFADLELEYSKMETIQQNNEIILKENRIKLEKQNQTEQNLQRDLDKITSDLAMLNSNEAIEQDELKLIQTDLINLEEEQKTLESTVQSLQVKIDNIQNELNQANLSEEDRRNQLQMIESELNQLSTQEAVCKVQIQQHKNKQQELENNAKELKEWIDKYLEQSNNKSQDITALNNQLESMLKSIEIKEQQSEKLSEEIQDYRLAREKLNEEINQSEIKKQNNQSQLQHYYQLIAKLEAQIEKNQSFIDTYLTYLNQEYQLSYEMAENLAVPIESVPKVQDQVKNLKRKIERLGPINLQAIDDFEELNNRYQKLVAQEADLLAAMSQLQETMDEMDVEVVSRFGQTFEMINEQFKISFKKLFGGGQASLELTDPDDLLTTGIDIIAQPPGKKKQNLALLSGGERALTAIALLFAILETKPVPFVVLDEVEAALDDANVYRYGEYIQTFTQQTQFIVITHRKGTMEHADVLYGVTMQQSGVSKLASVRLNEAEKE